jgi:uncharacterized MAPEG superfamily protein
MTVPLCCLLGFVGWMFCLLAAIGIDHFRLVGRGTADPSDLMADIPHGGDRHWRLHRAHLNCVENLAPFAAVVLTASVVGVRGATLDALSLIYLAARVCQSVTHVASGSNRAVIIRLGFFLTQWACLVAFAVVIIRAAR